MAAPSTAPRRLPALPDQLGIWFDIQGRGAANAYNIGGACWMDGPLDPARLEIALATVVGWHESLRLAFEATADGLMQHVAPCAPVSLNRIDCSAARDPEAAARHAMASRFDIPFDVSHAGLFRFDLLELAPRRWCWLGVFHHLIADAWAISMITRQVAAAYEALGRGEAPSRPAGGQWSEHAAEEQAYLESPRFSEDAAYWLDLHQPPSPPLFAPQKDGEEGSRVRRLLLPRERYQQLGAFAKSQGTNPSALFVAAIYALFARTEGQWDISLGIPTLNRRTARDKQTAGMFTTMSALRCHYAPALPFGELMRAIAAGQRRGYRHQRYPLAGLNRRLALAAAGRRHVFDIAFSFEVNDYEVTMEGRPLRIDTMVNTAGLHPLALFVRDYSGRDHVQIDFVYQRRYFDGATMERIADSFGSLLDALPKCAGLALADLPVRPAAARNSPAMPDAELSKVLRVFNDTARNLATRRTIPQLFLEQAARTGDAPAVLAGGQTLTYAGFARRAGAVAAALAACGVAPGDVVAVCARRSVDLMAAIHGVLISGAAWAPLDPDHPAARLQEMLEGLGHPVVLAAEDCAALFPSDRRLPIPSTAAEPALRSTGPDALAYVMFTSGSTGRPKGVAIEHHSVLNRILWMQETFPIGPGDVILQKTPVTFDVSVWELLWWSWTGAAVALAPAGAERDPRALADAVERCGVTVLHFVPSMLAAFLPAIEDGKVAASRLACLRYVFASGEALSAGLVERFNRLLHVPYGIELHNLYGPTEATVDVTWQPCSPWNGDKVVPIGRPIANALIRILSANGHAVPIGEPGEIYIGGPQVARGYLNRPDLTAARFVPDPFDATSRLYRTGDRGRWRADGAIEYLGRLDQQVKIRGFRVECGEIEQALEAHASVERAVVTAAEAGGLTELHAYLLGAGLDGAALRAHLRERLPEYMVPARFFRMETLPLTPSGKLDRKALTGHPLLSHEAAPESPVETELLAIWRQLLPERGFGLQDGFFDAGGHSLLLLRLQEHLERRWPGVFTVADLFSCANIAGQARRIEAAQAVQFTN